MTPAGINRHGTGTVDPVILAPTHADDLRSDAMEMLPLVSCVMSHFEREFKLSFEHFNNLRMLIHLPRVVSTLRSHYCIGPKMDRIDGDTLRVPKDVRCSIFDDVPPIRD